jgi:y4mF family transcriptional regulator
MGEKIPSGNIDDVKRLGSLLQKQRKQQGLTQVELAALCGVGVRFISDLENGKPTVELAKVLQVIQLLGLELTIQTRAWNLAKQTSTGEQ